MLVNNASPVSSACHALIGRGTIRCNRCGSARSGSLSGCPKCGNYRCHINIYHKGKSIKLYRDTLDIAFTYEAALDQLLAMNREMREKTFKIERWHHGNAKERTLEQTICRWLDQKKLEVEAGELAPATYHTYKSRIDTHILSKVYGLGLWAVKDIGFVELELFKDALPRTLKLDTRRDVLNTLRTFFRWAWRKGLVATVPPFPSIKGSDAVSRIALSIEAQYEALAKIPEAHRDIFEFEVESGIRPGEACALKIKDVDFASRMIRIRRTFSARKLRESDKEGHRWQIPLSDRAFALAEKNAANRFPEDWLFIHPGTNQHYTVHRLELYWKQYTCLPCTHYEGTRHSFCTQLSEVGSGRAVQDLMRHADSRSTDRYIHNRPEYLRDTLRKRAAVVDLMQWNARTLDAEK